MPEDIDGVPDKNRVTITPLEVVRTLVLIGALAAFALWGFTMWPFPWGLVLGIATPALALLIWALFISQKAVLRLHVFVRVLVELLIYAAATIAWWSMGQAWIGIAFAVVAVATGVISGRRSLR